MQRGVWQSIKKLYEKDFQLIIQIYLDNLEWRKACPAFVQLLSLGNNNYMKSVTLYFRQKSEIIDARGKQTTEKSHLKITEKQMKTQGLQQENQQSCKRDHGKANEEAED